VAERLTLDEALRAFSAGAAFAAFEESWRGRAAPGQAADLTIFDGPAARLTQAHIDATIVGGRVVYERH
jgi:predicted amidohydrolase YtcJ